MILSDRAQFDLALQLRRGEAPLGTLYAFMSGLYFRGKLAYAEAFASPPEGLTGSFVITPGRGLLPLHSTIARWAAVSAHAPI